MRILCPMCGFGREVDETKIPPRAQMATCPKCAHKFRFRVVDDPEADAAPVNFVPRGPDGRGMDGRVTEGQGADAPPPQNVTGRFPTGQDLSAAPPDPMAAQRAAAGQAWQRLQSQPKMDQAKAEQTEAEQPAVDQPAAPPADGGQPQPEASAPQTAKARSTGSPVPFEDLPLHGFFPGLWSTIRMLLTAPAAFFRVMPTHGGMAKPLAFHLLLAEFMVVCQYLWSLAGIGATAEYLGSAEMMDMGLGLAQAAPVMLFLIYPLLLVLRLMLMTGIIHMLLKLIRSGDSGAEATFRVLCYSAAPLIIGLVPAVGPLVGGVWSIGLTVIGLRYAHKTRASAALFAVLVPILMMLAAVIGLMQGMMKG